MINIQKLTKELNAIGYPLAGVCVFKEAPDKSKFGLADWFEKDGEVVRVDV
jgi:hypothetical protein